MIAVTAVNLMSLLDAISTLLLVENGSYAELNPMMDALMGHNYLSFFGTKMMLTLLGTMLIWHFYERRASARLYLKFISRFYCVIMIWHGLLLSGLIG